MIGFIAFAVTAWILLLLMRKSQNDFSPGLEAAPFGRARIISFTVVTAGLYIFYWLYVTWKQIRDRMETTDSGEKLFPVWHSLTMLVPVYGLFRLHRHVELIQNMAHRSEIATSLNPKLVVLLMVLNQILGITSSGVQNLVFLFLVNFISLALITTSIIWTQATLNEYWYVSGAENEREMPIQLGEVVFALIGIILWGSVIFGLSIG